MKQFMYVLVTFVVLGVLGVSIYMLTRNSEKPEEAEVLEIESLISQDAQYMDTIKCDTCVFYESRVVLQKPFNESDAFDVEEVTNVFQYIIDDKQGNIETSVYMFIHRGDTLIIDKHPGAFVTDDFEINMDSIKITFPEAFTLARQSNYPPSKSKYITLRHGLGAYPCNPFYTIGNDDLGHLWVDAVTGKVMSIDPSKTEIK